MMVRRNGRINTDLYSGRWGLRGASCQYARESWSVPHLGIAREMLVGLGGFDVDAVANIG